MKESSPDTRPALPQHPAAGFADGIRFALATLRHLQGQQPDLQINTEVCQALERAADEAKQPEPHTQGSHRTLPTADDTSQPPAPQHLNDPETHSSECGLPDCNYRASGLTDAEAQANLSRHLDDAHGPETETLAEAGQNAYRRCLSAAQSATAWFARTNEIPDIARRRRAMKLANESRLWSERAAERIDRAWRVARNGQHIPNAADP